jgi:glutathionylspermidine synthase
MRRETCVPRIDWRAKVEAIGFDFHTIDGEPYWREDVCYRFASDEIDTLEDATAELHSMCLEAVERIVSAGRYREFGLDDYAAGLVERSWRASEPALYGRMDLCFDGTSPPKLLEYNADTPTALFEASVVQWYWLQDVHPTADQFNSIHEKLIARWKQIYGGGTRLVGSPAAKIHFAACYEQAEDRATCEYLRDTAAQAGIEGIALDIEDVGWSGTEFIDLDDAAIATLFKLYPWEWLLDERFAANIAKVGMHWIEPAWKMLLSNKSILALLWEFFPDHPNLLPASQRRGDLTGAIQSSSIVRKPRHGREGEGVIVLGAGISEPAADAPQVYQQFQQLPHFDDRYALIGSWVVGHDPAGIGIREDADRITRNTSCFVPHYFD